MDSGPLLVDICSEEGGGDGDDYDWISELLEEFERQGHDGSDDGVLLNPKRRPTAEEGLDDDCVVLDGDPEKVDVVEGNANAAVESDDLLVVGEKGQIACRDYPHSRHLCANFPFTPVHMTGIVTSIDHCHANDKDEFWISQRQYSKQGDKAPPPVHKLPDTSPSALPQQNQCPTLTWLPPDSAALNQIFRPTAICASTSFDIPNITSQGRSQKYAHVLSRNKFQPHLVSQHLLTARNDFIQGDPRHDSGNLGPHIINSRKVFKRAGSRVALTTNRSRNGSFYNYLLTQYFRNASAAAASNDKNPSRWRSFPNRTTSNRNAYHPPSRQNMSSVFVNSVPSQTQVYSQPIPAVNDMQVGFQQVKDNFSALDQQLTEVDTSSIPPNRNAYHPPSHQNMSSVFVNSVPSQTQVYSQPIPGVNDMQVGVQQVNEDFSARDQQFSEVDTSLIPSNRNAYHPPFHQNMSSVFVNSVPSQTQVYSQPIPTVNDIQVGFQQVNENFSALDQRFFEVDTSSISCTGQSNEQDLPDNSQVLSAEFDPQVPLKTNPGSLDFLVDCWMLEYQSTFGALEVLEPSGLNFYSPEPVPVDMGFFLDF